MKDSHTRSVVKGLSWRCLGTLDTFIIATLVTGYEFEQAGLIAIAEIFTKIFFYYLHERIWGLLKKRYSESHYGSVGKAVSWRIVGTMDTILLSTLITGSFNKGISIGGIELVTKIVLYYLHERLWRIIPFGRISEESVGPELNNKAGDANAAQHKYGPSASASNSAKKKHSSS